MSDPSSSLSGTMFSLFHDTCAVVVTHRCGDSVLPTLDALLPQVGRLLIVENASSDETPEIVRRYATHHPQVSVIAHATNNLAAAQNAGIAQALRDGFGWVLLMDHDSIPHPDMLGRMRHAYERHPGFARIGLIAPNLHDRRSRKRTRYLRRGFGPFFRRSGFGVRATMSDVICVIASGSLIRRRVFEQIGLMDETLEIDDVDRDFSLRAVAAGWRILAVRDAVLDHQLGRAQDHEGFGLRVTTTNHSPERRYTIYRNRLRLWRRYAASLPSFLLFDALALLYDLARIALFETDRKAKLRAAFAGLRDGIRPQQSPASPAVLTLEGDPRG